MKLDASPSSAIFRIVPLAPPTLRAALGVSMVLLGAACGDSESGTVEPAGPSGSAMNPTDSAGPASPSAPAAPAGQPTANTESVASGPAPALDGAGPGATAPSADGGIPSQPAADASAPASNTGDAGPPPVTDPNVDENLVFIQEDGFQTTFFVQDCRSLGDDGSIIEAPIDGGALPVGGGFRLECSLERLPSRATTDVLSASDEPWCALGELESYEPGGDERLTISIVTPPDVSPAILIGTREGEAVEIQPAAAFGALVWPLWIEATYDVNEVAPAQQGLLCDQVFGL